MSWPRRSAATQTLLCGAATTVCATVYGDFFAGGEYLPRLLWCTAGGTLLAAVAAVRRWRASLTIAVAIMGFSAVAIYAVLTDTLVLGAPSGHSFVDLGWAVARGWLTMLTVTLPAQATAELLVTPALTVWTAAFAATSLALRGRQPLAPLVPIAACFVIALLFVASASTTQVAATAVLLAILLALAWMRGSGGSSVQLAQGVPVVTAVVLVSAFGLAPLHLATGQDRSDPRDLRPTRLEVADTISPLSTIRAQLQEKQPRRLFSVQVQAGDTASLTSIRLATLDAYDGSLWTSDDSYLVADTRLPPQPRVLRGRNFQIRVEIHDLPGPYLPIVGWPTALGSPHVGGRRVGFSDRSGTLIAEGGRLSDIAFDTTSTLYPVGPALSGAAVGAGGELDRYTKLPARGLPSQLGVLTRQVTAGAATPYEKLVAIERHLRAQPYSNESPVGHSYARLTEFLTNPSSASRVGNTEQHAAAFALMARSLGFPTRIAVGYQLRDAGSDGIRNVTTHAAHAWPEVYFGSFGWIPFEPTDTARVPVRNTAPDLIDAPAPRRAPSIPPSLPPKQLPTARQPTIPRSEDPPIWILPVGAAGLLVAGLAATLLAKGARRLRRRRQSDPSSQLIGAWREMADRLVEVGLRTPVALTAEEAAEHASRTLGGKADPMRELAPLVTSTVFSTHAPDHRTASHAWALEKQLGRRLHPGRVPAGRLRARLDPRPLWRPPGSRPPKPDTSIRGPK